MTLLACILVVLLAASVFVHMLMLRAASCSRRMVAVLQQKLRLKDERARQHQTLKQNITSDWVLIRAEGSVPLRASAAMQTWLLESKRMLLMTTHEDVWVNVTRNHDLIEIRANVKGASILASGETYNKACDIFLRTAYTMRARADACT